ncbi:MAG: tRNA lysidine(34) synthetase TilS [Oscillospiraceae bacterium]|jgi:tRNA(Ile)-lysidine synthase
MPESIEDRVISAIDKYGMGISGRNALVCVSGGPDSMALLHLFYSLGGRIGYRSMRAAHFNHGTRGRENDEEQRMVEGYCRNLGIPVSTGYGRITETGVPRGYSAEMWARKVRYDFFEEEQAKDDSLLIVAHTLNDCVETLLFNIARGSGIRGARGIEPVYGNVRRPLVRIAKAELMDYCAEHAVPYALDPSNRNDVYSRNRIRLDVIPELEKVNPSFLENAGRFCDFEDEAYRYIEKQVLDLLGRASLENGEYDSAVLDSADPYIRGMALKRILDDRFDGVRERDVELFGDVLDGKKGAFQMRGGYRVEGTENSVRVVPYGEEAGKASPEAADLDRDGCRVSFGTRVIKVSKRPMHGGQCSKNVYKSCIDYDKIIGNLFVRGRKQGDRFSIAVRHNTKTVKKLFQELGIPKEERDSYPLVCDASGIVWIPGAGPAEGKAVSKNTEYAVQFSIEEVSRADDVR